MAKLALERGIEARLLAYGGAHPFLHLIDVAAGSDIPMPSPADEGSDAVDSVLRRDGYLAYSQSHAIVTLPANLDGDWVAVEGRWGPTPALDPALMWVETATRDGASLVDRWGRVHRYVPFNGTHMLRAELDRGLVIEDDEGSVMLLAPDGTRTPWHNELVAQSVRGAIVAVQRQGDAVLRFDEAGVETGRVHIGTGWRWSFLGSLSPDGRYYLDLAMEDLPLAEVLKGAMSANRLVLADLDTGAVVPIDTAGQDTGYGIWDHTGSRVFLTTFRDLVTFTIDDPTLRRASSARITAGPLVDLTADLPSLPRTLPRRLAGPPSGSEARASAGGVRMVAAYDEAVHTGHWSRLAGCPSVPAGFEWPHADGEPLLFVGQVNLADLDGVPGTEELPAEGILAFWFDPREMPVWGLEETDRAYWRVAYFRGTSGLRDLEPPRQPDTVGRPLGFVPEAAAGPLGPFHRLLGEPNPIQEEEMMGDGWRLLLQIDSDSGVGFDWCGGGRLYVWIREDDFRRRGFEDCWVVLQTD